MIKNKLGYKTLTKNADTLTPVGIYKKLSGEKKFLLESSFQHETKGKYSFMGANPYEEIIGIGNQTKVINLATGEEKIIAQNALLYMKENLPKFEFDIPFPFTGGAIGFVGYDAIRQFANIGPELDDELELPDIHFMVYKTIIAYEHRKEKAHIITVNVDHAPESELDERLNKVVNDLEKQITATNTQLNASEFQPQISKEKFINKVKRAQEFIKNGDTEQIVISQRMVATFDGDPFSFYRELRTANPSPYMFYIDFTEYLIIGASPESLVQTTGSQIITNPIAGTRPRGTSHAEDVRLESELMADEKEVNEHMMLVQLSKDDLAAICDTEDIEVPVYMKVEKYEHVMHIVSEVHGKLRADKTSIDALIACLPAGTVSGSPKERAMQIINDIEDKRRGVYAGGIGYITFNHDINLAIAIRSLVVKEEKAYLQTGAGIVIDSVPEKEYEETLHKARSLTTISSKL